MPGLREQTGVLAAPSLHQDFPLGSDEDDAVLGVERASFFEFIGALRQQTAVIPVDL
jgi:hypothetical protein